MTCRIRKAGSRISIGQELVHVLHWMHAATASPPGVEATSLQKEGLSGTTLAGTGIETSAFMRIRVSRRLPHSGNTLCSRSRTSSVLHRAPGGAETEPADDSAGLGASVKYDSP